MQEEASSKQLIREDSDVFTNSTSKRKEAESNNNAQPLRLYKMRFAILVIFCVYSMSSAFQWIEYAIITNIMLNYYTGATPLMIQWTSMIYMLSYIPGMFIATALLDKYGLRTVILIGTTLNAAGSVIKCFSVDPSLFWLTFLGQTVSACAQSFILEVPPKLASIWFGPSEVSTATSMGVFGNQLGVALGFLLPPLIVPNSDDMDLVGHQILVMFIGSASVCVAVLLLSIPIFKDAPPHPPSFARKRSVAASMSQEDKEPLTLYKESLGVLMKDVPFLLLFVTYGVNTGTYYAIGTLLNPIMIEYHENAETEIGQIGLTMVVAGLAGSVLCGYILDRTKAYKMTTLVTYFLSMSFMIVFTFTLPKGLLWLDFITIGLLGFFMTGYLPIGFEFAAEITYPISEATSSGFLNVAAQVFGILFTLSAGELLDVGVFAANIFMSVALLVGSILTGPLSKRIAYDKAWWTGEGEKNNNINIYKCRGLIKANMKRQAANKSDFEMSNVQDTGLLL